MIQLLKTDHWHALVSIHGLALEGLSHVEVFTFSAKKDALESPNERVIGWKTFA